MESERGLRTRVAAHGIGAFRPIIHLLVGIPLYLWMSGPMVAQAHQSPMGCNGNGVRLNISRSPSPVPAGGTVTYTFSISNLDDGSIGLVACDVEDVDVVFYCPDANGSPDLSTPHVLTTTLNLPAGSVAQPVGSMQTCTMNVNPGVSDAVAEVRAGDQAGPLDNLAEGTLHDTVVDHPFRSQTQLGTFVVTATVTPTQTTTATPTQTATPTPTVTITPTPAILNHFQCYEIHGKSVASTVNLVDDTFGATTAAVGKPKRLCAPADKNDEDPTAPGDSDHLIAYGLRQTQPRAKDRQTVEVTNQFGTFALELTRADMLLVPSAKSIDITMPPQDYVPGIDHFKCHRIAGVRFRRSGITVDDQFPGTLTVDLKRPRRLCVAVEKNGEPRIDPAASLLCYKERSLFASARRGKVAILNQFEAGTFKVSEPRELCVPPLPPTPTPTATPSVFKRVFVTSTVHDGNLGGLAGADAICQARATAASLGGSWTAWLSDSTTSASNRITDAQYRRIDGITIVASSRADLTDGTLTSAISVDEFGNSPAPCVNPVECVWTGTSNFGMSLCFNNCCSDWTCNNPSTCMFPATAGLQDSTTTWSEDGPEGCFNAHHLYCFEN